MPASARPTCFIDFDGTLLDNRARYYQLYLDGLGEGASQPLSADAYWQLKRSRTSERDLASRTGFDGDFEGYAAWRLANIEVDAYLDLDTLFEGAVAALERARETYRVVLVTHRRKGAALRRQLTALGLDSLLDAVVHGPADGPSKAHLIRETDWVAHPDDMFVGDTEVDIRCARDLGCRAVAVTCGLRTPELLAIEKPDALVEGIWDAL